ncbi:hypothetical protein DRQ32_09425 [bacterium]|nr:MAG: hypothetical protein DRQ32_09425 [bacterium]
MAKQCRQADGRGQACAVAHLVGHLVAGAVAGALHIPYPRGLRERGDRMQTEKRELVALNGRFTAVDQPTGVQAAAGELFTQLVLADRPFDLLIYADSTAGVVREWAGAPGVRIEHVPFRSWGRARAQLHEQIVISRRARQAGARLLYHPINTCPRYQGHQGHLPQVVTLHDLNFHHNPQWYGRSFRTWLEHTTIPGLSRAAHVVCISDHVVGDAIRTLELDPGRVSRIYDGLRRLSPGREVARDRDLVLAVNPFQPHKNLPRLIEAMSILRKERPSVRLRVVGRAQENFRGHEKIADALAVEWVHLTGYIDETQLAEEYCAASVLCMPSFEEGFGMPLIEAMSFGASVVTSNLSCLPETAGPAGILIDPHSAQSIADGLRTALTESGAGREAREEAGRAHAARFSWATAAAEYTELFSRLMR